MTRVYLIRHAEAEGNLYRRIHGWYDSLVTDNGYRQISALADRFRGVPIDAVYSSDLFRTQTTAGAVYRPKGLELRTDPALREVHMGIWEDRTWGEVARTDGARLKCFNDTGDDWQVEEGETFAQVGERMRSALLRLAAAHDGGTIALFSHGTAIRTLQWTLKGLDGAARRTQGHSDNTAVTCLEVEGDRVRFLFENDNSHLTEEISTLAKQRWWKSKESSLADANMWHRRLGGGSVRSMLGEEQVGVLELDPETDSREGAGFITKLWMEPSRRGQGLGIQLVGEAVSLFRPLGRTALRALCPEDPAAKRFCEKYGFRKIGERDGLDLVEKYIGY